MQPHDKIGSSIFDRDNLSQVNHLDSSRKTNLRQLRTVVVHRLYFAKTNGRDDSIHAWITQCAAGKERFASGCRLLLFNT